MRKYKPSKRPVRRLAWMEPIREADNETDGEGEHAEPYPECPITRTNGQHCKRFICSWWVEDAQKCAVLALAEVQRKLVKGGKM